MVAEGVKWGQDSREGVLTRDRKQVRWGHVDYSENLYFCSECSEKLIQDLTSSGLHLKRCTLAAVLEIGGPGRNQAHCVGYTMAR